MHSIQIKFTIILSLWKQKCFIIKSCLFSLFSIAHLKKSSLQNSLSSLEKHLSCSVVLQSKHLTQLACHARSNTFNRNLSRIGFWHPAHVRSIAKPHPPSDRPNEPTQFIINIKQNALNIIRAVEYNNNKLFLYG